MYSDEFKIEAVSLANQSNVPLKQIAEELGVNPAMLGRWQREMSQHGQKAFIGQGNARDQEVMALKRELARVKKERDFLKEAAVDSTEQCNIYTKILFCMGSVDETNIYFRRERLGFQSLEGRSRI